MRQFNNNNNLQEIWSISTTNKFLWCQYQSILMTHLAIIFQSFYAITGHCSFFQKFLCIKEKLDLFIQVLHWAIMTLTSMNFMYTAWTFILSGSIWSFTWVTLWLRLARSSLGLGSAFRFKVVFFLHNDDKILPKAGHSPLLWEHPQYLQSVYWDLPLKFAGFISYFIHTN